MKKMSKRNLWLAAIILSYLYMLISKKMINTYKENEILVLNYSASMICDFALLGMFIIRQAKMKKRFQIFKNSFQSFKDAYSKKSAFEKNLKNFWRASPGAGEGRLGQSSKEKISSTVHPKTWAMSMASFREGL